MSEKKPVTLARPITIGDHQVVSLMVDPDFKIGWLRKAPTTPAWFIGVVKGALSGIDLDDPEASKDIDPNELLKNIPTPSGEEASEMIPWLLHIAEQATGQAPAVIDQLTLPDLFGVLINLVPGMIGIANFRKTSGSGGETSPGSSGGPPLQ